MPKLRRAALRAMAAYYIVTGVWPLLSRRTFEAVTGPKTDWWLVQMVGLLAAGNGAALAVASTKKKLRGQTLTLALASATSFAAIDIAYVSRGRISKVYLGDAAVEVALAAALLLR